MSPRAITDESGLIAEEFSFDPWGKRRAPSLGLLENLLGSWETLTTAQRRNQTIDAVLLGSAVTNRGFTGHEQMDPVALIHMNGRVYDAEIGRFLSADPFVRDITNLQALNRYSYVENNPLSYTDPSGYFLKKLFKKIASVVRDVVREWRRFLKRVVRAQGRLFGRIPGPIRDVLVAVACGGQPLCYAAMQARISMSVAYANGGTIKQSLKAGAVAFVSSYHEATRIGIPSKWGDVAGKKLAFDATVKAVGGDSRGADDTEPNPSSFDRVLGWVLKAATEKAEAVEEGAQKGQAALDLISKHKNTIISAARARGVNPQHVA
ncbi:RHS repeat-associated core domain-containing protein, partial [Exilibacterium tricleocarpae]